MLYTQFGVVFVFGNEGLVMHCVIVHFSGIVVHLCFLGEVGVGEMRKEITRWRIEKFG